MTITILELGRAIRLERQAVLDELAGADASDKWAMARELRVAVGQPADTARRAQTDRRVTYPVWARREENPYDYGRNPA